MLFFETISDQARKILTEICGNPYFNSFALAGGTSLSLRWGHRISYDLDFFGTMEIDPHDIGDQLPKGNRHVMHRTKNILVYQLNDVKVDFVNHMYPLISPVEFVEEGIRLFGIPDVAAMKVAAITGRGTRRDFFDFYFLLQSHKLEEIMKWYEMKYSDGNRFLALKSLIYFNDADSDAPVNQIKGPEWSEIKDYIKNCVQQSNL